MTPRKNAWTTKEIKILRQVYAGRSHRPAVIVGEILGRRADCVRKQAQRLGIRSVHWRNKPKTGKPQ